MKLEDKIAEVDREEALRYPLIEVVTNRKEIREISEKTLDLLYQMRPDIVKVLPWVVIPTSVVEFLKAIIEKVNDEKEKQACDVYAQVGNIMTIGIEYLGTPTSAGKEGTFNPTISVGPELSYENKDIPYDDSVSVDMMNIMTAEGCPSLHPQFFDNREFILAASQKATNVMVSKRAIVIKDTTILPSVFVAFFRTVRDYLVDHKDFGEFGLNINLADIIDFGIEKYGDEEHPEYNIYITPGQIFKKDNAKSDALSELKGV